MKAFSIAAVAGLLLAAPVGAQQRAVGGGLRLPVPPSHSNSSLGANMPPACRHGCFSWERGSGFRHGFHRGFGGVWIIERPVPVVIEREVVVREVAVTPPPAPPHQGEGSKRKPYEVGASYAELPDGCMKMIEGGVSYFYCAGEWYRQSGGKYVAVARKL